jgi:hypothetical protein
MMRENASKFAKTKAHKEIRLARKLRELERKRMKDNIDKYHYEIKDNNVVKIQGGI